MPAPLNKFWTLAFGRSRRNKTEEALRLAEAKFRRIFEDSLEGLYQTTADGRFISANPALARMLGYATPEELMANRTDIGRQGYVQPERREEFKRLMAAHGVVRGFEYEVWRKDGTTIWVSENSRAVRGPDGALRYYEGSMADITERKHAEAELRAKQSQLLEALRMARLAYWEYDVLADTFHFNDQFYAMLRTTAETQGGYTMASATYAQRFVFPEDMPLVGEEIGRALAATDPNYSRELDHRVIFGDGEIGHIAVHIRIEKDATGRTIRTHGANMDITERKRAELKFKEMFESAQRAIEQQRALELQLRQSQKTEALGTLAGGIAHDFNNLLTAILGHADLALLDLPAQHPAVPNVKALRQAGLRSRDLVQQILLFSRRTETTRAPIRLQNVIDESFLLLRSTIPAMVAIDRHVDPRCLPIYGDANQIHQVLMNLCTNAWHALPPSGGRIELRLEMVSAGAVPEGSRPPRGDYVQLTVTDNGQGMDPKTLERIYDPFFTTKPVGKGTGLGLSMVHGIVKAHDGTINVRSAPGRGSSFRICFPAAVVETNVADEPVREIPRGRGERVLYVDDDRLASKAVKTLLERFGYRVRHEALPADALARFRRTPHDFDLVITDLAMPGMPGSELAAQVLALRPEIPVVLISGFIDEASSEMVRLLGIREVVRKPASPENLAAAVRRALSPE